MQDKIERMRLVILKTIKEAGAPLGSQQIARRLAERGYDISERTVRLHLLGMDREGLTTYRAKRGRELTPLGFQETLKARVHEKIGFVSARIGQMAHAMTFDLPSITGTVIVNTSLVRRRDLPRAASLMGRVFEKKLSMGSLAVLFAPGERIGASKIPEGYVGVGTVCSATLIGVLLMHRIPVSPRFGGLLEVRNNRPSRFVAVINYDGTSIDPLEIFIKSKMTDYLGATGDGNGLIGAGFLELPGNAREDAVAVAHRLEEIGLGGFLEIGAVSEPLIGTRVAEDNAGAIVIGGLNPIAILEEAGLEVYSCAMCGLVDYRRLFPYGELADRAARTQDP